MLGTNLVTHFSWIRICIYENQDPVGPIDILWLDWAYKSSTCDVMYRRQRRHVYYGGQI
jgi:hypothetical protein